MRGGNRLFFEPISQSIADGEAEKTLELTKQAVARGYPVKVVLEKGLLAGINRVAARFRENRVMVPEVLMATRAMHAGLSVIEPYLKATARKGLGTIVMGTVAGDLHDIGITLVKMLTMSTGVRIVDLGVDVTPKRFAAAVRKEQANILMMSALLTTTMSVMKDVVDELVTADLRKDVLVIVGGAPVTASFARTIGADYYFENAFEVSAFLQENLAKIVAKKNRPEQRG